MSIGERIKQARKASGLTQTELAKKVGIGQDRVARWEKGVIAPASNHLTMLAHVFNCTTDWLLGLVDSQQASLAEEALSADERRLIELYRTGGLPFEVQRLITENPGAQTQKYLAVNREHQTPVTGEHKTTDSDPV